MSSVNKDKQYVITYKELIFTLFVFVAILIALYPKDLLKQQIVSEKSNYDLSMLYLKNLLKHNPNDESLMLILARQSLKTGNKDLAIRLLELLFQSKKLKVRQQALLLSYELEKEKYFYSNDPLFHKTQMRQLKKIFNMIYHGKMYDPKNIKKWYDEALFVGAKQPMYTLLKQYIAQEKITDVKLLEQAYFLSMEFKEKELSFQYIDLLLKYDTQHEKKWVLQKYYMYMNYKEYAKAEALLLQYAKDDETFQNILAEFYFYRKKYTKASQLYLSLYNEEKDSTRKQIFFKKSVNALLAGQRLNDAVALAKKHEHEFLHDEEMRQFILKLYVSSGHLDSAAALSEKILKLKYKR